MALEADSTVLLYAELLPNIRQISVGCSLPSPSSAQTQVDISSDGAHLSVTHDGAKSSLQLPGRVQGSLKPAVREGLTSLTFRLPVLAPAGAAPGGGFTRPAADPQAVPWSAMDIAGGTAVLCRQCEATVVKQDVLASWKDLPSENWAEMMEFWHCHKPDNHKDHNGHQHGPQQDASHAEQHLAATRGYGASSRIAAQPGLGFVDLTSFLVSTADIVPDSLSEPAVYPVPGADSEQEKSPAVNNRQLAVCRLCQSRLGLITHETRSVSLFKWQVSVMTGTAVQKPGRSAPGATPTLSHCVSAMLVASLAWTGCSKSILMPLKGSSSSSQLNSPAVTSDRLVHIWLFNPNILFTSSEVARRRGSIDGPQAAIKVLFKLVGHDEADKLVHSMTSDTQDVSLPADAIETMIGLLEKSNSYLPHSERRFKEWSVGLVDRWEE